MMVRTGLLTILGVTLKRLPAVRGGYDFPVDLVPSEFGRAPLLTPWEERSMPDRGEARAMVDQMLELIIQMNAAERAKRELALGTPEFVERALEVERIARMAFRWSQFQLQMAERAAERRARGELTTPSVSSTSSRGRSTSSFPTGGRLSCGSRSHARARSKRRLPLTTSSACGRNIRAASRRRPLSPVARRPLGSLKGMLGALLPRCNAVRFTVCAAAPLSHRSGGGARPGPRSIV